MDKWEYIRPEKYLTVADLNELGKQGWEIASFDPNTDAQYTFKRKIPSAPSQNVQRPSQQNKNRQIDDDFGLTF